MLTYLLCQVSDCFLTAVKTSKRVRTSPVYTSRLLRVTSYLRYHSAHLFAACDVILEVSFCLTCLLRVMSYLRYPSAHLFMCTLHLEVSFCSPVHVYVHCVLVLENVTVSCFN